MIPKLVLIGGGGHCESCIDVIEKSKKFEIIGIVDPNLRVGTDVSGYPVLGGDDELSNLKAITKYALITVGQIKNYNIRVNLYNKLKKLDYCLPVIISPLAYIAKNVFIDEGTIVMHQALINSNAKIGKNCIINTKSLIEHGVEVHDHCHISTATIINGDSRVCKCSFVGSNSVVVNGTIVPEMSFIKANQLVKG
ncbi:acetyltransferase [Paraphotobacterium marinum]|uniref:Acetyltransferase n=1 Tax=Paraphotobacterium marinum TaxID=1755811 RepID=A0A220VCJ2_9GAMM|nr:acetyltransferase [Paraphotobacterium marinum]ASK78114.1 acetyltransferase [Paraphotobacterium marinum]